MYQFEIFLKTFRFCWFLCTDRDAFVQFFCSRRNQCDLHFTNCNVFGSQSVFFVSSSKYMYAYICKHLFLKSIFNCEHLKNIEFRLTTYKHTCAIVIQWGNFKTCATVLNFSTHGFLVLFLFKSNYCASHVSIPSSKPQTKNMPSSWCHKPICVTIMYLYLSVNYYSTLVCANCECFFAFWIFQILYCD